MFCSVVVVAGLSFIALGEKGCEAGVVVVASGFVDVDASVFSVIVCIVVVENFFIIGVMFVSDVEVF